MTAVQDLADHYIDELAVLDPCLAAVMGIAGQEDRLTDFSPEAAQAREDLARHTLRAIDAAPISADSDRVAAAMLRERLSTEVALAEADAYGTLLDTIDGPIQRVRHAVELLDQGADTSWTALLARLRAIPETLAGLRESLEAARRRGVVAAYRQLTRNAQQCRALRHYLAGLPGRPDNGQSRDDLAAAVAAATAALTSFQTYLMAELASAAPEREALGRDRYQLGVREFLGTRLDLEHTYAWGWHELAEVRREMTAAAKQISPGQSVSAVMAALDSDPTHQMSSPEAFRNWIQELADGAVADLDGTHFSIPEPLRRIDCRITPTDGVAVYLAPSEDAVRPGSVWWPLPDTDAPISTWTVPSTIFHEAVPGHHLQLGMATLNTVTLNRFQRLSSELHPGHCEGWALYAERLMDELGYLAHPAHRLGMLFGQQLRAARIVLDIGLHLQLPIPEGTGFHDGERWTPQLAKEFLSSCCGLRGSGLVDFEVDRYLGRPGQAIAYKIGEKVWLEVRDAARQGSGAAFDLAQFHQRALDLGPMGLDLLRAELTSGRGHPQVLRV